MRDVRLLLVLVVALGIIVGGGVAVPVLMDRLTPHAERPEALALQVPAEAPLAIPPDVEAFSQTFRTAAARVQPAVVAISTSQAVEASAVPFGFGDDFLRRFFGMEPGRPETPQSPQPRQEFRRQGLGSGVIVSADGYILTNNHVVAGADEITVHLADDREFDAKVIGADPPTDIALIKVQVEGLSAAVLGDSDKMEVGDWVLAIGAPLGLQKTVTAGIISAKGRANVGVADYEDFLQTDAAINPGNSGGPLVNMRGEVVGINTAIASRSGYGGNMGIGFAVPSNMARDVMTRLHEKGEVVRGWLGVSIQNLSKDLAQSMGLEDARGALVGQVFKDGPADKAGIQAGDIIVEYAGKPVKDVTELRTVVAWTEPDTEVEVVLVRDKVRQTVTVAIKRRPEQPEAMLGGPAAGPAQFQELGIEVSDVTPEAAQRFGYAEGQGVLITSVDPRGLAARAGLQAGMLIVQAGRQPVRSVAEFKEVMAKADLARGVPFLVRAGDRQVFVLLKKR